jgi:hypothetical protein
VTEGTTDGGTILVGGVTGEGVTDPVAVGVTDVGLGATGVGVTPGFAVGLTLGLTVGLTLGFTVGFTAVGVVVLVGVAVPGASVVPQPMLPKARADIKSPNRCFCMTNSVGGLALAQVPLALSAPI